MINWNLFQKVFCKIGLHWPMRNHTIAFLDIVNSKQIYYAECPCGEKWMVDTKCPYPLFKVNQKQKMEK